MCCNSLHTPCWVFIALCLSLDLPRVCPGHMKDAFITTITMKTKTKQTGRRLLVEESDPLHLALTLVANSARVELLGLIGLCPLEQQSLLWGSHISLIVASKATRLSSASRGHILEPASLAAIGFLEEEKMDQRKHCHSAGGRSWERDWQSLQISWSSLWFILSWRVRWTRCLTSLRWSH